MAGRRAVNIKKTNKMTAVKAKVAIALLIFQILSLFSCRGADVSRSADISIYDTAEFMLSLTGRQDMKKLDTEEIKFTLGVTPDDYTEAAVYVCSGGASIDEFGIFRSDAESKSRLIEALREYISSSQAGKIEWLNSYNPPEAEKLEDAYIEEYGDVVVYSFCGNEAADELREYLKNGGIY